MRNDMAFPEKSIAYEKIERAAKRDRWPKARV